MQTGKTLKILQYFKKYKSCEVWLVFMFTLSVKLARNFI